MGLKTGMRAANFRLLGMTAIAGKTPQQLRLPLVPAISQSWVGGRDSWGPTSPR